MRKTWNYPLLWPTARTRRAGCAWRPCLRSVHPQSGGSASCPAVTTSSVSPVSARGARRNSSRTSLSSTYSFHRDLFTYLVLTDLIFVYFLHAVSKNICFNYLHDCVGLRIFILLNYVNVYYHTFLYVSLFDRCVTVLCVMIHYMQYLPITKYHYVIRYTVIKRDESCQIPHICTYVH